MRLLFIFLATVFGCLAAHAESLNLPSLIKNGGVRVEDDSGRVLLSYRDDENFIPASILKVATAYCALEELGKDYRWRTEVLFDTSTRTLYVKGSGDPSTVSEELAQIARNVSEKVRRIDAVVIDTSLFVDSLEIDGASPSRNPYDAKNAAFVGNFSSAALSRRKDGVVVSAEPQTPLTPISRRVGAQLKRGTTERVKIGNRWQDGALYGGELLAEFLAQAGVQGARKVSLGRTSREAKLLFTHTSSQSLEEILRGMLEHSTNFTANQIFLTLGVSKFGPPADLEKAQRSMTECLQKRVGWRNFHIEEGSGLSRRNKVSAHLMTTLLTKFSPYRDLLPTKEGFLAKTGSLNGVNSLAGYYTLPKKGKARFAIIINSNVPFMYKFTVARKIEEYLTQRGN